MGIPINSKKQQISGSMFDLRAQKIKQEGPFKGTYRNSFKDVWDNLMTEEEKEGYTFNQIYNYMINTKKI